MTAPYVPQTVIQRFIRAKLVGDAAITAIVPASRIVPNVGPSSIGKNRHLVHAFAGPEGGVRVMPIGAPRAQIALRWDITAWEPDYSQQALEPLMEAVQTVLIGSDDLGLVHRYVDGSRLWTVEVQYGGPVQVPLEATPAGIWAPISERYTVALRQAA
jgi:hypothetical protein